MVFSDRGLSSERENAMITISNGVRLVAPQTDGKPFPTIDTEDPTATNYWAYRLSVSHDDLMAAIEKVGPSLAAVRRHLGR
jgi:uncharacterized protein DUF3606